MEKLGYVVNCLLSSVNTGAMIGQHLQPLIVSAAVSL